MTKHFLHGCLDLSEREVQAGVVEKLEEAGWYVRSFSSDRRAHSQLEGWPDLVAFKFDHTLLLECKATKRGSLRDKQKGFAARLEAHRGPHLQRLTIRHPIEIEPWLVPGEGGWKC